MEWDSLEEERGGPLIDVDGNFWPIDITHPKPDSDSERPVYDLKEVADGPCNSPI
jgi:hypothetical protein